ncbi:MAG TPA: DUF6364 family protein [Hanamia sp.]
MKARLNLTIDESLLNNIKSYAARQHTSVSELVEIYFKNITRSSKRKNIIDLVNELKPPSMDIDTDLKELFYQEQAKKYGF